MHTRVVRFEDVTSERLEAVLSRIREAGGPPPGVRARKLQVLFDERQGTAVVLQHYASEADLEEGGRVLSEMDAGETPGRRVSVDSCEVKLEVEPGA